MVVKQPRNLFSLFCYKTDLLSNNLQPPCNTKTLHDLLVILRSMCKPDRCKYMQNRKANFAQVKAHLRGLRIG